MGRSRNWHDLRSPNIKNPKYTNCRHLCPYCTPRVSKSSDHCCAFGTMSNFEKRNLRSGHLMWPGGVTFGVIGSSFFGNVSNCWLNSYAKFGGARRRRFSLSAKNLRGGGGYPPAVRGLRWYGMLFKHFEYASLRCSRQTGRGNIILIVTSQWRHVGLTPNVNPRPAGGGGAKGPPVVFRK